MFWGSKIGQHRCQNAPATQCAPKIRGALFSTAQNAAVHFGAIRTNLKFQIHRFSGFPEKERCVQEQETSKTSKRSRRQASKQEAKEEQPSQTTTQWRKKGCHVLLGWGRRSTCLNKQSWFSKNMTSLSSKPLNSSSKMHSCMDRRLVNESEYK